jgi:hypothetical protein
MMDDHDHPELDFDPLDDTKVWPEELFEPKKVGTLQLNRNVENFFAENEQISFGTGVLVDGLDFSDDKMLIGRTFSYSDTQRYRVGPNYLHDARAHTVTLIGRCRHRRAERRQRFRVERLNVRSFQQCCLATVNSRASAYRTRTASTTSLS